MLKFFKMLQQPTAISLRNTHTLHARIPHTTYRTAEIFRHSRAFCTDTGSKDTSFNLYLFNSRNKSHIKQLNTTIETEIARNEEKIEPLKLTHQEMVEWLKTYVDCSDFMAFYTDERSLEMIAEATFWSIELGLEKHLAQMCYEEIRAFQPLMERLTKQTPRARAINEVCSKLKKPAMSYEASFALGQAALCVYVHHNSYEQLKTKEATYDSNDSSPYRLRP